MNTVDISLRPPQGVVYQSPARFRALVAGRRFGKTYLACFELLSAAARGKDQTVWYVGPTYKLAKRVAWKHLKRLTKLYWAHKPNESDLTIELTWGSTISLRGADNYDNLRGEGLDFLVCDEYADMAPEAWTEVLRPSLSDKLGRALFIGTPKGFNHFYDLWSSAADKPDWAAFQYTTADGGNVAMSEIESAKHELDERIYRQEYGASFENLSSGRVYYTFSREGNVQPQTYNGGPIFWAMDFNIDPMSSVIGQNYGGYVRILDEMVLPDTRTEQACEEFGRRAKLLSPEAMLDVVVYGDSSGTQRKSSASQTDWQIVREYFARNNGRFEARFNVPSANPAVRDRVNAVNSMLCNFAGNRRLVVDPQCRELIRDFDQVSWKQDSNGNPMNDMDKSNPARTHVSDALGYMVNREYPLRSKSGERSERIL